MISFKVSRVTAILDKNTANHLISALEDIGHRHIYIQEGRNPVLSHHNNLMSIFTGKKSLFSTPVKIISVYVQSNQELNTLNLIAKEAKLLKSGIGTVFSEPCHLFEGSNTEIENLSYPVDQTSTSFVSELTGICCIVQRGEADTLARALLQSGMGTPTIHYGTGTGLREKIGLLRITIPAEKEIINLVVSKWDAAKVVESLIAIGRLHLPGRGFINTFPINKGILNTRYSQGPRYHAATIEQMIAAIDSLQGNMDWRGAGLHQEESEKREYLDGADLNIICNAGHGVSLVRAAMAAGCTGATIEQFRMIQIQSQKAKISPARERCKMMIKHNQVHLIIKAIKEVGAFTAEKQAIVLSQDVPRAFTYLRKA